MSTLGALTIAAAARRALRSGRRAAPGPGLLRRPRRSPHEHSGDIAHPHRPSAVDGVPVGRRRHRQRRHAGAHPPRRGRRHDAPPERACQPAGPHTSRAPTPLTGCAGSRQCAHGQEWPAMTGRAAGDLADNVVHRPGTARSGRGRDRRHAPGAIADAEALGRASIARAAGAETPASPRGKASASETHYRASRSSFPVV